MNPLVDAYLKRLDATVEALGTAIGEQNAVLARRKEAHENALRQYWSKGKDAAILRAEQEDSARYAEEAARYRAILEDMRPHLMQMLQQTKTLRGLLEP